MKTVLVTGASGNLGSAVAHKFEREGDRVIRLTSPRGKVDPQLQPGEYPLDLFDETAVRTTLGDIYAQFKSIDVAVLTVGGFSAGQLATTDLAAIHQQIKLNFDTAFGVAKPVFEHMMSEGHGRIFLIGSRPGLSAEHSKGLLAYGLAKSLVVRFAEMLNIEAAGTDVVTSVIVPSTIDTPQNRASMTKVDPSGWVSPQSIADIIYFYASSTASDLREPLIKVYGGV